MDANTQTEFQLDVDVVLDNDPRKIAEAAGLIYVSDDMPGYHRKVWGRGFTYLDPQGDHVSDSELRERFESLVIPPAWTDVWICPQPNGHIQATGRDTKGRKQYIYHAQWEEVRNRNKFNRLAVFGQMLPALRAHVDQDLRRRKLSREKVLAIVVQLLDETLIRIGNYEYARLNHSYGLTTLKNEHLEIEGSRLHFVFDGKSGKHQDIDLRDRRLARAVQRCQDLPGQRLFQYREENGECCQPVDSGDVNEYLRAVTGESFSAKDFRTWGASVLAVDALLSGGPAQDEKEAHERIVEAIKEAASGLGNTPAVCREYYVHPLVLEAFRDDRLFAVARLVDEMGKIPDDFSREEQILMEVIRPGLDLVIEEDET